MVEVGAGGVAFPATPAIDATLGLHYDFTRGEAFEVRARGGVRFNVPSPMVDGLITGTALHDADDSARADICAPLDGGPIVELTHRLVMNRSGLAQFFVAH